MNLQDRSAKLNYKTETETAIVDSSFIESVSYLEEETVLEVEFKNGLTYRYFSVPKEIYENLKDAQSVGSTFNKEVLDQYIFEVV